MYELLERGKKNGVERLEVLDREQVLKLEPYVSKEVVAGLYSPDAGNLIPYEFAIALMENAVDNGVELRTRRQVTAIRRDGAAFEVSARHWEPEGAEVQKSDGNGGSVAALWRGFALGLGALAMQRAGFSTLVSTATAVVAAIVMAVVWNVFKKGKDASSNAPPPPSVGTGGSIIPPEQMKDGGSGSATVMKGKTVEIEKFTATYVINCAGSASDKIANMIGDKVRSL